MTNSAQMFAMLKNFLINSLLIIIKCYKYGVSSANGPRCRFLPTCSDYAEEAVKVHGPYRGILLTISRLIRCNVLAKQRVDPVPRKKTMKFRTTILLIIFSFTLLFLWDEWIKYNSDIVRYHQDRCNRLNSIS